MTTLSRDASFLPVDILHWVHQAIRSQILWETVFLYSQHIVKLSVSPQIAEVYPRMLFFSLHNTTDNTKICFCIFLLNIFFINSFSIMTSDQRKYLPWSIIWHKIIFQSNLCLSESFQFFHYFIPLKIHFIFLSTKVWVSCLPLLPLHPHPLPYHYPPPSLPPRYVSAPRL